MQHLKKQLAVFLLFAFFWAMLPGPLLHAMFADHHDTADNECAVHHKGLGLHVEKQHVHCEVLKVQGPAYDQPALLVCRDARPVWHERFAAAPRITYYHLRFHTKPSRGPPAA